MSWEGYSAVMIYDMMDWGDCDVYILKCEKKKYGIWFLMFYQF